MSLFEACQRVDIEEIKFLIKENYNINQLDEQGRTALHYCSNHQTIDCANLLLENNLIKQSILNLQDNEGCSALHLACLNGNITMVKYLCEQNANVKLVDNESHSLIHWITVCGHVHLFDILFQYEAPIHTSDIYGAYPIHYASQLCGSDHDATKRLMILKKLIENNADINCLDKQKRTPFIWAASVGATDALRILYKAGAGPLHVDKDSLTALHCTTTGGHTFCIRMLVELYGCSVESEDINGCTALFYAITLEQLNACQILLDLKANPNHQDNRGRTPSHCAAFKGNIDCLKRLIKFHADIWIKNKRNDYPIHEAIQKKCFDIVRYVFKLYPKNINIRNGEHRTPLHLAASLGDIEMCKLLIEFGAKVNSFIKTSAGNFLTPYDLARIRCHDKCAEYLVYNHGGQRGNLLAHILARRIQKYFRQYQIRKTSYTKMIDNNNTNKYSSSTDHLLYQAKLCLDNKIIEDRLKSNAKKNQNYLVSNTKDEDTNVLQRRQIFSKSKTMTTTINHETYPADKIIIHTSNSIATSVKLYERHKLIAEELFKLKQARIHDHHFVINRPLYKILIENAFNPQKRHIDEIEKYLETLLKAYENELEAIRKRTKSASPRRMPKTAKNKTRERE